MTSFFDDQAIIEYCNNNPNDNKCACIIPNENILKFSRSSFTPYYCWYTGCLREENFKTSLILEEQKLCNITLCEISLGDVNITGGNMNINNDCASLISPTTVLTQRVAEYRNMEVNFLIRPLFYSVSAILLILIL